MTPAAALAELAAFLDPARAFSPAADLAPMRRALKALQDAAAPPPPKARKAAADLARRLRNPPWPESIPLSASEAMEEAARMIDSALQGAGILQAPARSNFPGLWYVAVYGENALGGGYSDCLLQVAFFDSPLAYGRACREAEAMHARGDCDSFTMGRAESSAQALARMTEGRRVASNVRARAAYLKEGGRP